MKFRNQRKWSERSFWPYIKPWFSEFSKRGCLQWCAIPITLPDKQLPVSEEFSIRDTAQPCCIFHLRRCVIYIHFYGINLITQGVTTPSFASGATKHSKSSAAGIWSGFNLKRCVTAHAVPTGYPGKGDVLSLHTGLRLCASDKSVPYVCSLSRSEQRKQLSLLLSSK